LDVCGGFAAGNLATFRRLERDGSYDTEPIRLEGCSSELKQLLIESLPYTDYQSDLSGCVAEFASIVAQAFVYDGAITFEIDAGWSLANGQMVLKAAKLNRIPSRSLFTLGPIVYEFVPANVANERRVDRGIRLDSSRIVSFRPPRFWRHAFDRLRAGFRLLEQSERAWMGQLGARNLEESVKEVRRQYNIQLARISAPVGWTARGRFRDDISDFHAVIRELRWKRCCIEVRDHILRTLGTTFGVVGQLRGERPQLVWDQLPTIEQVEDGERTIATGGRFRDVLKPFR
jgi:hypothetical protein